MNRGYGGAQSRMRESKIIEHGAYLACINVRTLSVGDTQSYPFQAGNVGPFWMTHAEEANCHDCILPPPPGDPRTQNKNSCGTQN
jgi:hypothetical protein